MSIKVFVDGKEVKKPFLIKIPRMSAKEFFIITNEDSNFELMNGELICKSPASYKHEELFGFVYSLLRLFTEKYKLGKVLGSRFAVKLSDFDVFEPDIIFVKNENTDKIKDKYFEGCPDAVIEILSPWTKNYDLIEKKEKYKQYGVKEMWFIDPDNLEIYFYHRDENYKEKKFKEGKVFSREINGFFINVEWLANPVNVSECLKEMEEK